jgi:hypothetical protein
VKADDLIDDVARRMTTVDGRPALRTRVAAVIDAAPQDTRRAWVLPVAVTAVAASAALAWFLMPSATVTSRGPVTTEQAMVAAPGLPSASVAASEQVPVAVDAGEQHLPATVVASEARASRAAVPPAGSASSSAPVAPASDSTAYPWAGTAPPDIPMLPPLAGPPAIVIEPIAWNEVAIAPLTVELIEIKALVVEPLASPEESGA